MSFGFSAGDFISALNLISTIITSLLSANGSKTQYRLLTTQLTNLHAALSAIQDLKIDDSQRHLVISLQTTAGQCQRCLEQFWAKVGKYQPHLGEDGGGWKVKEAWMKIRWALCEKDDLEEFRANLLGYTLAVESLLSVIQMASTEAQKKNHNEQHKAVAGMIQQSYSGCMQYLSVIVGQGKILLETTNNIVALNVQIFQAVLQIRELINRIPGQVEKPPVYLIDAMNRRTYFDPNLIQSSEILLTVLRESHKAIPIAAGKFNRKLITFYDQGEDAPPNRLVDLNGDWTNAFRPGRTYKMYFESWQVLRPVLCVVCGTLCENFVDGWIYCMLCAVKFKIMESGEAIDQLYGHPKDESGCPVDTGPKYWDNEGESVFIDSDGAKHSLNAGYSPGPPINPDLLSTIDFARLSPEYYCFSVTDFDRNPAIRSAVHKYNERKMGERQKRMITGSKVLESQPTFGLRMKHSTPETE